MTKHAAGRYHREETARDAPSPGPPTMILVRRIPIAAVFSLCGLSGLPCGAGTGAVSEICVPGRGTPHLMLHDGRVTEGSEREVVWDGRTGRATSLACSGETLVVGVADDRRGRLVWLERADERWTVVKETGTRGTPSRLVMSEGRVAAVVTGRRESKLVLDARGWSRPVERVLAGEPACLAASPDGELVLVGKDDRLVTYRSENAGTWVVFELEEEITGCATRAGVPRMLVAHGPRLVLVDLRDRPERGRLPVRASAELDADVERLAWTGDGELIAAALGSPPRVLYLGGSDLRVAHREDVDALPVAMAGLAAGWVVTADADGRLDEHRVPDALLAEALLTPAPARIVEEPPEPPPAPEPDRRARRPVIAEEEKMPSPPVQPEPAEEDVAAVRPRVPEPPEPALKGKSGASPDAEKKIDPVPAPEPDARPDSAGQEIEVPVPASAPEEKIEIDIAETAPAPPRPPRAPEPLPPPAPEAKPVRERIDGSEPSSWAAAGAPPRTLRGVVTGETRLVDAIVVLGPDSILKERARLTLRTEGGVTFFVLKDVPPGQYRLIPMGGGGASLVTRPAFAVATVGDDAGGRADFEIVKVLP